MFKELKRLFRHSLTYGIGQSLGKLASFLILPIILRYLTPGDYGILEIFVVSIGIMTTFFGFSMNSAIFRYYYKSNLPDGKAGNTEEKKSLVSSAFWGLCIISVPVILIFMLFSKPLSFGFWDSGFYTIFFVVAFITIIGRILNNIPYAILRAREESIRFIKFSLFSLFLTLILNVYFVVVLKKSALGILLGNMFGTVFLLLLFSNVLSKNLNLSFSWMRFSNLLKFGFPIVPVLLTFMVVDISDRFFLKHFSTLEELGRYALAYKFGILMSILLVQPFNMAWKPFAMSIENKENAKDIYSRVLTYFLFIALFLWLGLSLFSQNIIHLIAPQSYWNAYKVIPVIALAYVLLGISYNVSIGIYLTEKTKYYPYIAGGTAGLNIILNYLLIPVLGVTGAALATVCSYATMAGAMFLVSQKFYKIQYEWLRLFKLCLTCAILYIPLSLTEVTALWIRVVIFISFPIVLYLFGFFGKEEVLKIRASLHI
ncbi:oligosaccharide flippase family protein [candidate division WOR-3 bacterium]|nr:oligosaccharide flippase family protein [candidate division WOR-3 bacterium]